MGGRLEGSGKALMREREGTEGLGDGKGWGEGDEGSDTKTCEENKNAENTGLCTIRVKFRHLNPFFFCFNAKKVTSITPR